MHGVAGDGPASAGGALLVGDASQTSGHTEEARPEAVSGSAADRVPATATSDLTSPEQMTRTNRHEAERQAVDAAPLRTTDARQAIDTAPVAEPAETQSATYSLDQAGANVLSVPHTQDGDVADGRGGTGRGSEIGRDAAGPAIPDREATRAERPRRSGDLSSPALPVPERVPWTPSVPPPDRQSGSAAPSAPLPLSDREVGSIAGGDRRAPDAGAWNLPDGSERVETPRLDPGGDPLRPA